MPLFLTTKGESFTADMVINSDNSTVVISDPQSPMANLFYFLKSWLTLFYLVMNFYFFCCLYIYIYNLTNKIKFFDKENIKIFLIN